MRLAAKIATFVLLFSALGFCVAFVFEELIHRAQNGFVSSRPADLSSDRPIGPSPSALAAIEDETEVGVSALEKPELSSIIDLTESLLGAGRVNGRLLLESKLAAIAGGDLQELFVEMMARDLEDRQAVDFAGRILREIAQRDPGLGVALLYSLTPAEREALSRPLAAGWITANPASGFEWIESAWIDDEGAFIDRALQNELYLHAMDTLVSEVKDYAYAATILEGILDLELRGRLTEAVARAIVRNGPEMALERLASLGSPLLDGPVLDAIASEWADRDGVGAMLWTLDNEAELSNNGIRSIAKQLVLNDAAKDLARFHGDLLDVSRRDTVAAEAARLTARRDPILSADWVSAIEQPQAKLGAVYDALYEIGYESFDFSVDYIDLVYTPSEPDRVPVLFSTLKQWVQVDRSSVVNYVSSPRAGLSPAMTADLLMGEAEL